MNRRWILGALAVALPAAAAAQLDSLKALLGDPLVGAVKSKLGVTDAQAEGGLGSILTLAQEKLARFQRTAKIGEEFKNVLKSGSTPTFSGGVRVLGHAILKSEYRLQQFRRNTAMAPNVGIHTRVRRFRRSRDRLRHSFTKT